MKMCSGEIYVDICTRYSAMSSLFIRAMEATNSLTKLQLECCHQTCGVTHLVHWNENFQWIPMYSFSQPSSEWKPIIFNDQGSFTQHCSRPSFQAEVVPWFLWEILTRSSLLPTNHKNFIILTLQLANKVLNRIVEHSPSRARECTGVLTFSWKKFCSQGTNRYSLLFEMSCHCPFLSSKSNWNKQMSLKIYSMTVLEEFGGLYNLAAKKDVKER